MRALGKQRHRAKELGDLLVGIAVTEHRQGKRRLGDEHVARHQLKRRAGRIGNVLVVAGGDDAEPVRRDRDLRGAEHMTGGMERDFGAAEIDAFAIADRLRSSGETLAVAQPHQVEGLLRRQHRAMAGAGMVGVGMGDQRPLDRPGRVDVEGAELAAYAGRRRRQDVFGPHRHQISSRRHCGSRMAARRNP